MAKKGEKSVKKQIRDNARKHKTRKLSIRAKIMIPATIIIILICCSMGFMFKARIESDMVKTGAELAEYVGTITIDKINGQLVSALKPGEEKSAAYIALKKSMEEVQKGSPIRYMYTLYTDGQKVYYGLELGDDPTPIGTEFEESYSVLKPAFEGKKIRQEKMDKTKDGAVISAYLPIYDRKKNLVGVLGCDYDANGIERAIRNTLTNVVLIGIICVVVAFLIFQFIISRVTRNLWRVDDKIYDIVNSNGDLTQTINIKTGDETESIAGHVNELLAYIREIMANIFDNSRQLNHSSESVVSHLKSTQDNVSEVSSTMEEMTATMEQTTSSLNQINESVNEVYAFIEEINRHAQEGGSLSDEIRESAERTQKNAITEQNSAKQLTQKISETVHEKIQQSKDAEKIADLTADIINIADQTRLLSLNASIEAARAGDAGRGFAVVADEIGKLSTDSGAAAEQIKQVSAEVIKAVNALAEEAARLLEFVENKALNGYSDLVATSEEYNKQAVKINDMMQVFGQQSEQLQRNMDEIRQVIDTVNESVEESANGVTRITEMSVNITENVNDIEGQADKNMDIANMLDQEVNKFKIE